MEHVDKYDQGCKNSDAQHMTLLLLAIQIAIVGFVLFAADHLIGLN